MAAPGTAAADVDARGHLAETITVEAPAFHDLTPAIRLHYMSSSGNGFAGVGWSLEAGSTITRVSAHHGVARGDATDVYLLDGTELVPCSATSASPSCSTARTAFPGTSGFYSTQIESFQRIRQESTSWTVWSKDGTRRLFETVDGGLTFRMTSVVDPRGNTVHYSSWCDPGGACYPDAITYANAPGASGAEIRFVREARADWLVVAGNGTMAHRLRAIVVSMDGKLVRVYQLSYARSQTNGASVISSFEQFGSDAVLTSSGSYTAGPTPALPALGFLSPSQQAGSVTETRLVTDRGVTALAFTPSVYPKRFEGDASVQVPYRVGNYQNDGDGEFVERPHGQIVGDFNGDGRGDWLAWSISNTNCTRIDITSVRSTKTGSLPPVMSVLVAGPGPQTNLPKAQRCRPRFIPFDLDGDRSDDLVVIADTKLIQLRSSSNGTFQAGSMTTWAGKPERCGVTDVDGDGRDDLLCTGTATGSVALTVARSMGDGTWQITSDLLAGLGVTTGAHDLVTGDFNGDGLGDVTIVTEVGGFWRLLAGTSDGLGGFTWEVQSTTWRAAADTVPDLDAADLDGDGRRDLVVEHTYLGFAGKGATGRFRLETAPTPLVGRYGDCDGDGRTDLLGATSCLLGLGDGRFGAPISLPPATPFIPTSPVATSEEMLVDLNGDGRSDLLRVSDEQWTYTLYGATITPAIADERDWMQGDLTGDGVTELIHISHLAPGYLITSVSTLNQATKYTTVLPTASVPGMDEPDMGRFLVMDVGSATGAPDGRADLVLVDVIAGGLRVYTLFSNGDGTFTPRLSAPIALPVPRDPQNWRPASIDSDGRGDLVHVVTHGSGVTIEALRSNGDGSWTPSSNAYFGTTAGLSSYDVLSMDVSGDGLTDFVSVDGSTTMSSSIIRTLLGNGDGTFTERTSPATAAFRDLRRVKLADIDGDGLGDLVHLARTGPVGASRIDMQIYLADGNGGWRYEAHAVGVTSALAEDANALEDVNLTRFVDVDGDRRADLVHLSTYLDGAGLLSAALLVAHNPGTGAAYDWPAERTKNMPFWSPTVNYGYDAWRWQAFVDPAVGDAALLYVDPTQSRALYFRAPSDRVTKIGNSRAGITNITYAPLLGRRTYLPEGSRPVVVTTVEVREDGEHPVSELREYSYGEAQFSTVRGELGFGWRSMASGDTVEITRDSVDDACGARMTQRIMTNRAAAVFAHRAISYVGATAAGGPPYTCNQYIVDDYECEGTATCRQARSVRSTPDQYGNVVTIEAIADQAVQRTTLRPTAPINALAYIVDKPAYDASFAITPTGSNLIALTTFGYDGNPFITGPGAVGALTSIDRYDATTGTYRTTTQTYTPSGMPDTTTDPRMQTKSTAYDLRYGLFPRVSCRGALCSSVVFDPGTARPTEITDANGARAEMHYDAHGRLVWTKRPTGGITTIAYLQAGQVVRTQTADTSADKVGWAETSYDGLGRVVRTAREGGATIDVRYADASGRPAMVSQPYLAGSTPAAWTSYEYDLLGRRSRTIAADGTERTTTFEIGKTTRTDELGHATIVHADGRGNIVRIEEPTSWGTPVTNYTHDAADRLRAVSDDAGNLTTIDYDSLGRRVATSDPDRGEQKFSYLPNDLLEVERDAMGQLIRYTYDADGRLVLREDVDPQGKVMRAASWRWDRDGNAAMHGASLGRIVEMTDVQSTASVGTTYAYDAEGHAVETTRCVDGTCLGMHSSYDIAGRLAAMTYPDSSGGFSKKSERVEYLYDDAGRLRSVGGYLTALAYDPDGRETSATYGNGLVTATTYSEARRWVETVTTTSPIQGQIYAATYAHDVAGRIENLAETTTAQAALTYQYDELGRLIGVVATDPARSERFAFDEIGRMIWSTAAGDIQYTDAKHAHAPTSSDLGFRRGYDELGNVTSLSDPDGRALTLTWNVDNTLASTTANGATTTFTYDPSGARVKKSAASGDTLELSPYLEIVQGRTVKNYRAGDRLIARRDGSQLTYYTQDLTHSTRAITDAAGRVISRFTYSAFGRVIASTEMVAQDHEHGGGRHDDESGLTYMNARYYDPALMHFISADSIVPDRNDPQSFHRYSYAQQDPIDFWDPSGHMRASVEYKKELEARAANFGAREAATCAGVASSFSGFACGADAVSYLIQQTEIAAAVVAEKEKEKAKAEAEAEAEAARKAQEPEESQEDPADQIDRTNNLDDHKGIDRTAAPAAKPLTPPKPSSPKDPTTPSKLVEVVGAVYLLGMSIKHTLMDEGFETPIGRVTFGFGGLMPEAPTMGTQGDFVGKQDPLRSLDLDHRGGVTAELELGGYIITTPKGARALITVTFP